MWIPAGREPKGAAGAPRKAERWISGMRPSVDAFHSNAAIVGMDADDFEVAIAEEVAPRDGIGNEITAHPEHRKENAQQQRKGRGRFEKDLAEANHAAAPFGDRPHSGH